VPAPIAPPSPVVVTGSPAEPPAPTDVVAAPPSPLVAPTVVAVVTTPPEDASSTFQNSARGSNPLQLTSAISHTSW
jgi:hypothetical protein